MLRWLCGLKIEKKKMQESVNMVIKKCWLRSFGHDEHKLDTLNVRIMVTGWNIVQWWRWMEQDKVVPGRTAGTVLRIWRIWGLSLNKL